MNPIQEQVNYTTKLMAKRVSMDMYGVKEGVRTHKTTIRDNFLGKVVKLEKIDVRRDVLENPVLSSRIFRYGLYRRLYEIGQWFIRISST